MSENELKSCVSYLLCCIIDKIINVLDKRFYDNFDIICSDGTHYTYQLIFFENM